MNFESITYDEQWKRLHDFIAYNPGARHRRRMIQNGIVKLGVQHPTVIDVGCGLGFTVKSIAEVLPQADILGIDFSATAIEGAQARFPQHNWRIVDLRRPPEGLEHKIVVCTEVIEHLDDWRIGLSNVLSFVENQGFLILTTQAGKVHSTERAVGHERHFKESDLTDYLQERGFSIVESRTWGWPGYVALKYLANINSSTTLERLGTSSYGALARMANSAAYYFTRFTSIQRSRLGSQIFIVAQRGR